MGIRSFFNNVNLHFDGLGNLILANYDQRNSPLLMSSNLGQNNSKMINLFSGKLKKFINTPYEQNTLRIFCETHQFLKQIDFLNLEEISPNKAKTSNLSFKMDLNTTPEKYEHELSLELISEITNKWKMFRFGQKYCTFRLQDRKNGSIYIFKLKGVTKLSDLAASTVPSSTEREIEIKLLQVIEGLGQDRKKLSLTTNQTYFDTVCIKGVVYIGNLVHLLPGKEQWLEWHRDI